MEIADISDAFRLHLAMTKALPKSAELQMVSVDLYRDKSGDRVVLGWFWGVDGKKFSVERHISVRELINARSVMAIFDAKIADATLQIESIEAVRKRRDEDRKMIEVKEEETNG
ncbi:MAG: hypothetical protein GF355_09645 [Candidatus Eisenbacteria bacterium]|nr:hypothetical protein [Candidatus Eisenbacteria bacterium]